jgi:hypothetical protein
MRGVRNRGQRKDAKGKICLQKPEDNDNWLTGINNCWPLAAGCELLF